MKVEHSTQVQGINLSVLMPVYNAELTIRDAVQSTLKSMPENSELLIQLDGCVDDSRTVIETISDDRIRIFESKENLGIAATLNSLLSHARGKCIARMDQDDICLPGRFKKQLNGMRVLNSDLLFGKAVLWNPKKLFSFFPVPSPRFSREELDLALIRSNPLVHPTMMATKSCLEALGGYRQSVAEDYELWLRARTHGFQIDRLNSYLILYRVHDKQLTKRLEWQQKLDRDQNLIESLTSFSQKVLGLRPRERMGLTDTSDALWNELVTIYKPNIFLRWKLLGLKATLQSLRRKK